MNDEKPRIRIPWRALTMVGALARHLGRLLARRRTARSSCPRNLSLLARQMSVTAILAVGMVLVIVAGQIDLSVGAMAGLLGAVAAMASSTAAGRWPPPSRSRSSSARCWAAAQGTWWPGSASRPSS